MESPPERILIVDDDPQILQFMREILEDEGYSVICATNGVEALEHSAQTPLSLILLDMSMPVMDGWQFASEYRRRPGPHAPIVCVTAAQDVRQRAEQIGANAFLAKPFDLDRLLTLVEGLTAPASS